MSHKEAVLEAVRQMPDEADMDEIRERIAILARIRQGQEDIAAGRFLTLEEVEKRFAAWAIK